MAVSETISGEKRNESLASVSLATHTYSKTTRM